MLSLKNLDAVVFQFCLYVVYIMPKKQTAHWSPKSLNKLQRKHPMLTNNDKWHVHVKTLRHSKKMHDPCRCMFQKCLETLETIVRLGKIVLLQLPFPQGIWPKFPVGIFPLTVIKYTKPSVDWSTKSNHSQTKFQSIPKTPSKQFFVVSFFTAWSLFISSSVLCKVQ